MNTFVQWFFFINKNKVTIDISSETLSGPSGSLTKGTKLIFFRMS